MRRVPATARRGDRRRYGQSRHRNPYSRRGGVDRDRRSRLAWSSSRRALSHSVLRYLARSVEHVGQFAPQIGSELPRRAGKIGALDRVGDTRCDTSHEIEVVSGVRSARCIPSRRERASQLTAGNDRHTDRAVEPAHREELVELGRQQRADVALRNLRDEHRLATVCHTLGVRGLSELFGSQHRAHQRRPLRVRGDQTLPAASCCEDRSSAPRPRHR